MNIMNMLKNGLSKFMTKGFVYWFFIPGLLLVCLIYLFSFSGLSGHNKKLQRFEEMFSVINHPPDTQKLGYEKYLGGNFTANGDGPNECFYLVAEVRTFSGNFEEIESYYDDSEKYFTGEFKDGWIYTAPFVSNEYGPRPSYPLPMELWDDSYSEIGFDSTYVIFANFSDLKDTLGDYRCWRE